MQHDRNGSSYLPSLPRASVQSHVVAHERRSQSSIPHLVQQLKCFLPRSASPTGIDGGVEAHLEGRGRLDLCYPLRSMPVTQTLGFTGPRRAIRIDRLMGGYSINHERTIAKSYMPMGVPLSSVKLISYS